MSQDKIQTIFFVSSIALVAALLFFIFLPYLTTLVFATVLAIVFEPLYRRLLAGVNTPSLAALGTIFVILILLFLPLTFFTIQVIKEAGQLYNSLAAGKGLQFLNDTASFLQTKLSIINPSAELKLDEFLRQALAWILGSAGAVFSSVAQFLFGFLLSMLALYYLLKDGNKVISTLITLSPLTDSDDKEIFGKLRIAVHSVIRGSLVIALIQGFLVAIGFYTFGVPNGALWGAVAAVAALIPFLGTTLVTVPAITYLFLTGNAVSGLGLLIWGATAVGLIDNLLTPKLIGRGTQIHPLLILFAVLGGLSFFGPIGFLMGPLTLSLFFALLDIYRKQTVPAK